MTAAGTPSRRVSAELAAAIADYWARLAEANAPGAGDELTELLIRPGRS